MYNNSIFINKLSLFIDIFIKLFTLIYIILFSICKSHKSYCSVFINCLLYVKSFIYLTFSHCLIILLNN